MRLVVLGNNFMQYTVDLSKSPIGPPIRIFKSLFWCDVETKESLAQTKAWKQYIILFHEALVCSRRV